mgnify:FL=1
MQLIEIYTSSTCGYCFAAKRLLNQKDVTFQEINIQMDPERRAEMIARAAGQRSVPQIFIGAQHVGGCDQLFNLERTGKLDAMLAV